MKLTGKNANPMIIDFFLSEVPGATKKDFLEWMQSEETVQSPIRFYAFVHKISIQEAMKINGFEVEE
ncbi:hypothetical protein BG262_02740 [Floricoccus penangensis]|uniref:Uncharacterized protein n=1 Tax=Floricoccus penangensis TaxID=1859475 RepID=A0A9Q5NZL9_9LACT|nr:hypothetical protein [Floricoccus penangensis]OFI46733.1 hypothetical protein BG262_02740 [Floricoccus penangensis]